MLFLGKDNCPKCGTTLNACAPAADGPPVPNPGDVTICLKCATFLKFGDDMALQLLTLREFDRLRDKEQLELIEARITILHQMAESK